MYTTNRISGKLAIIGFAILLIIIIGFKTAKFAEKVSSNTQNRINSAFEVLKK